MTLYSSADWQSAGGSYRHGNTDQYSGHRRAHHYNLGALLVASARWVGAARRAWRVDAEEQSTRRNGERQQYRVGVTA